MSQQNNQRIYVPTDNWTVANTTVSKVIRFDPNQNLSLTRLQSIAIKASTNTTGSNIAPNPFDTTTVAENLIKPPYM